MTDAEFQAKLDEFIQQYDAIYKEHYVSNYPSLRVPRVFRDGGSTYQRISVDNGTQTFVICFVALVDGSNKAQGPWVRGDIFKPGGYKAPQPRGKRGSIFTAPFDKVPKGQLPSWYA